MIQKLYEIFKQHPQISTDSRKVEKGAIFFALKGENFDGNIYAESALKKGARYAVIDNPEYKKDDRYLLVNDTLEALQELATLHRQSLNTKVIAIVGSNGKTTTKELISRVLSNKFKTFSTPGNFNNHIGVPLSILQLTEEHEFAVIEIGANHIGENMALLKIAAPQWGMVTNCGKDHLEGFGSPEGVIQSNKELYDYLKFVDGACFVNADDQTLLDISTGLKSYYYKSSDVISDVISGKMISKFPFLKVQIQKNERYKSPSFFIESRLFGAFHLYNILAAVSIGLHFGVEADFIKEAIETYNPKNNRSQLFLWGTNKVLLDAYNSNPSSLVPMINDFAEFETKNKMIILGDMFELGEYSDEEHINILELLKKKDIKKVVLVGLIFKKFKHLIDGHHFDHVGELKIWLAEQKPEEQFIFVKGSRGIGLEKAF